MLVVVLIAIGRPFMGAGFCLAMVLLAVFSVVLAMALRKRDTVNCNCFGPGERRVSRYDLARNALLFGSCAVGLWSCYQASAGRPLAVALTCLLALMAVVYVTVTINLQYIVELLRHQPLFE